MSDMPRQEHPKPQFSRATWLNLNGRWRFALDLGRSGEERGWATDPAALDQQIVVPFCPESALSGVAHTDFIPSVWYHRSVTIPSDWAGQRVLLHFGGVDYDCRAWVNGQLVGRHYGGSASFAFDITAALVPGENQIVVNALDDVRSQVQASGKQSPKYHSHACLYTRVTGIWQTVWLEARPATCLDRVRIVPDLDAGRFHLTPANPQRHARPHASGPRPGSRPTVAQIRCRPTPARAATSCWPTRGRGRRHRPLRLTFELSTTARCGRRAELCRLAKFHVEGHRVILNNEPLFLRFVLDQGSTPTHLERAD